jgi:flagellar hook-associated protein 3 FlgL
LGDTSSGLSLQHQENLSKLQDLDYAKAISEFTQQQVQLEAAQKSFVQISGLSLFNYL